jgi:predicted nucleotide-binding protein
VQLRENLWSKKEKPLEKKPNFQARPNVIFEAGMALGRHPEKTIFVTVGKVKEFSDIAGKHMIFLDNSSRSRRQLAKRLESMGCPIELDGDDWESAGNFSVR